MINCCNMFFAKLFTVYLWDRMVKGEEEARKGWKLENWSAVVLVGEDFDSG